MKRQIPFFLLFLLGAASYGDDAKESKPEQNKKSLIDCRQESKF